MEYVEKGELFDYIRLCGKYHPGVTQNPITARGQNPLAADNGHLVPAILLGSPPRPQTLEHPADLQSGHKGRRLRPEHKIRPPKLKALGLLRVAMLCPSRDAAGRAVQGRGCGCVEYGRDAVCDG
jgi:hypothetical protein